MNGKEQTILIVDDFASIRKVIGETLLRHGFQIIEAGSGQEALDILQKDDQVIHVILSDYNMPKMSGYELLVKVKGDPKLRRHPFILLTSEKDTEKKKKAREAGLDAWIEKPYKIDSFISLIRYSIERSQRHVTI